MQGRRRPAHQAYQPPYNELHGGEAQFLVDDHDYYTTPRGYHARAVNSGNAWTITTPLAFMNMPILTYIAEISPRPVLVIHGENAHSRYFSETASSGRSRAMYQSSTGRAILR